MPQKWFRDRQKKLPPPVYPEREEGWEPPTLPWESFCRSVHSVESHGDPRGPCSTLDEHKARIAEESGMIVDMIRQLDHVIEVAKERKEKGQVTLWDANG